MTEDLEIQRKKIFQDLLEKDVEICAVTKYVGLEELKNLIKDLPELKNFGENRWPDCEEKFRYLEGCLENAKRHFIGPLQTNKVRKILPQIEVIQSVDSEKLMNKIQEEAEKLKDSPKNSSKIFEIFFQVNISQDPKKQGLTPAQTLDLIKIYQEKKAANQFPNLKLNGLMTIGAQTDVQTCRQYFRKFKEFFDQINQDFFPQIPLQYLSMGMSADYKIAVEEGANMVRLGSVLF